MVQSLLVVLIVMGCSAYALWALMPAAGRRRVAAALLRVPLPGALSTRLGAASQAASGCGSCGSCGGAAKASPRAGAQSITFHPRIKR